jgi:hypothetical protein
MSDLANFQRDFIAAIDGATVSPPMLAVYRNTSMKGAVDALADNYPTVAMILGEEAFVSLAIAFVRHAPPDNPVLAAYGAGFADWLETHEVSAMLPYLSGVAQIDRWQTEAHLAPDAPCLSPALVATMTAAEWSASKAVLHPAVRFGWFSLPAPSIWLAHRKADVEEIAPDWRAEGVLLTRQHGAVIGRPIGAAEHRILFGLRIGETVGRAASVTASLYPQANITGAFRDIVASGALSTLRKGH